MRSRKGTKLRQAEKGFPQGFIILSLKTHSVGHANDDDDDGKRSLGHGDDDGATPFNSDNDDCDL